MAFDLKACILSTASLAALAAATPTMAQVAEPATEAAGEEIVVTGTNIRGTEVIGSAVQALSAEDVAKSGKATIADLVRELPANFAGGVASSDNNRGGQDGSSAGANLTGGAGINLRGLGALSTLVLVNGRRVAVSGQFGDFVDISNIPVAAIERIEILQDGGSAVYGSDAVGGVVNIILKKQQDGLTVLGRVGILTEGDEMEYQASAVWGTSWAGGNLLIGYEYNRRDNVLANDRGIQGDLSGRGGVNWPRYTSRAGSAANIFSATAGFNANVAYTVPGGSGTGLTVAQLNPVTGGVGNTFDPWNTYDILPEMERHSAFASIDHSFGDRLTAHLGGRYTKRDGSYLLGYPGFWGSVPSTSPAFIPGVTNNFGVVVDDRPLRRDVGVDSWAGEASLRYNVAGDWFVEATGSYSEERQTRYSRLLRDSNAVERLSTGAFAPSSIVCSLQGATPAVPNPAQAYCAGLNYQTWNPYSTQPVSDAVYNQLVGFEDLTFTSRVLQGTLKADGALFSMPGGDVKLAFGIDWRREKIDGELTFNYRSLNTTTVPYGATQQDVFAAFGEVAVPLVSPDNAMPGIARLDFSGAVRYERSDDLAGFETTNPKFGVRYAPVEGFNLRGSWGTSFHAAPMRFQYNGPQPVPGGNAIFYNNGIYTAPCNTTLVQLNGQVGTPGSATGNCTFTGMVVSGGAGPTLKPERATTWSVGLDIAPPTIPGLRLSLNYFNLEVEDRLVRITSGALAGILANYFATGSSPYIGNLDFNPSVATTTALFNDPRFIGQTGTGPARTPSQIQAIIYATQSNLATLRMDGVDIAGSYRFEVAPDVRLSIFGNGTIIGSYDLQATPGGAFQKKLGLYESTGNPVSFKAKAGVGVDAGGFSGLLTANYVGGYKCASGCYVPSATGAPVLNTQPLAIDSWTTFDLQVGYEFRGEGALGGLRVTVSANNLFNKAPPFIDTGRIVNGNAPEPYDAANASIIGRQVALTVSKSF